MLSTALHANSSQFAKSPRRILAWSFGALPFQHFGRLQGSSPGSRQLRLLLVGEFGIVVLGRCSAGFFAVCKQYEDSFAELLSLKQLDVATADFSSSQMGHM